VKPVPDGYSVVTELDGTPRAVIRTTRLERRRFRDVDAAFAWDEGEGDRTLEDWKDGHRRFFAREMSAVGRAFDEDMEVDLERFELLYPFEAAMHPVDCGPRIVPACLPGGLLASAELQIDYYARCHGFGPAFESERRRDIDRFLEEHDAARDGVWLLVDRGRVLGSIAIDGRGAVPELRWFIVAEALHGQGWGRRLMARAMDWCARRHARVVLHTFSALAGARRLYEAFGFAQIGGESAYSGYGPTIIDQGFEWRREARQSGTIRP
jgi:GNAT superfamily N-acetyltransferase